MASSIAARILRGAKKTICRCNPGAWARRIGPMLGDAPRGFETPVQDLWLADAVGYHVHCVLKSEGRRMLLVSELELVGAPCPGETLWRPRAGG